MISNFVIQTKFRNDNHHVIDIIVFFWKMTIDLDVILQSFNWWYFFLQMTEHLRYAETLTIRIQKVKIFLLMIQIIQKKNSFFLGFHASCYFVSILVFSFFFLILFVYTREFVTTSFLQDSMSISVTDYPSFFQSITIPSFKVKYIYIYIHEDNPIIEFLHDTIYLIIFISYSEFVFFFKSTAFVSRQEYPHRSIVSYLFPCSRISIFFFNLHRSLFMSSLPFSFDILNFSLCKWFVYASDTLSSHDSLCTHLFLKKKQNLIREYHIWAEFDSRISYL